MAAAERIDGLVLGVDHVADGQDLLPSQLLLALVVTVATGADVPSLPILGLPAESTNSWALSPC